MIRTRIMNRNLKQITMTDATRWNKSIMAVNTATNSHNLLSVELLGKMENISGYKESFQKAFAQELSRPTMATAKTSNKKLLLFAAVTIGVIYVIKNTDAKTKLAQAQTAVKGI